MATRVFILLGGLVSTDGVVTSAGLYALKPMLEKIPGVTASIHPWAAWQQVSKDMEAAKRRGDKVAVIGYSGGGKAASWISYYTYHGEIDLMVAWDPSPAWYMKPINSTVKKAICFYNTAPAMFGLGGGKLFYQDASRQVETIPIAMQHLLVQAMPSLFQRTVEEVRKLACTQ